MVSPEVMGAVNTLLLAVLTGITTVVIPMGYRLAKAWAESKISKARAEIEAIQDERRRAETETRLRLVEYSFERLDHVVSNIVAEITQTVDFNANLSDDEKQRRLSLAYSRVKKQFPLELQQQLSGVVKDFDRYLVTKIEAARFAQKQAGPMEKECAPQV